MSNRFDSIEQAVRELKLDRRHRWFVFQGELVRNGKALMECSGCDGAGCIECGGRKMTYRHFPIYVINQGQTVKINGNQNTR